MSLQSYSSISEVLQELQTSKETPRSDKLQSGHFRNRGREVGTIFHEASKEKEHE
jgi:hypothetical protein